MWKQAVIPEFAMVLKGKSFALCLKRSASSHQHDERELTHRVIGQFLPGEFHKVVHSHHQPKLTTGVRDGY
jgi:hypothetical protein